MRPQSMSMLGVFAVIDLLALFALFPEPSLGPDELALCAPTPSELVEPKSLDDVHLTAQHSEFVHELRQRMEPQAGPSDDDPTPVPVHRDAELDDPRQRSPHEIGEPGDAAETDALAASDIGI